MCFSIFSAFGLLRLFVSKHSEDCGWLLNLGLHVISQQMLYQLSEPTTCPVKPRNFRSKGTLKQRADNMKTRFQDNLFISGYGQYILQFFFSTLVDGSVLGRPLWSRQRYLNTYWMNWLHVFYRRCRQMGLCLSCCVYRTRRGRIDYLKAQSSRVVTCLLMFSEMAMEVYFFVGRYLHIF